MKRASIVLVIALVIVLLGAMLSVGVDQDFGKIHTQRLYLVNDNGYTVTANLFMPNSATAENPAPAFIVVPGGDCPSDIGSPWATELARRGFVVALVDYSGCGDTDPDPTSQYWTNPDGAMELDTVYDFIAALDFVDETNIGVGGHSMGSLYSYRLSLVRPVSVVVSDVLFADAPADYDFSFVQISGTHDEGLLARLNTFDEMYTDAFLCGIFGTEKIEPNKLYGSWENRTARIFIPLNQTHQDDMVSGQFMKALVESVSSAQGAPNPLPGDDLIYGWKIFAHIVMIIGLVGALFALGGLLLESSLFSSLKLAAPEKNAGLKAGSKGFWIWGLILTLIPVAFFFPGTAVGNKMASNSLFQLGTTPNGYLIWMLFSACALLVYLLVYHFVTGKKQGANAKFYGLASSDEKGFSLGYILKSALLALVLFLFAYCVLTLIFRFANTDIHVWTNSLRPFNAARSATMPWYFLGILPYFALFMICGGILDFGEGKKGTVKSIILGTLVCLAGMILLLAFHEITLRTNRPFYTGNFAHFYLDLLTNLLPQFAIASALAVYLRKKTNSVYPGAFLGTAMLAFGMVSTNCLAMIIS
jgi:pimeloyl-ACP methyl ester carboxylesterase